VAAYCNSGNIHLREALELAAQQALAQSPQAVELAKQQYREALRRDPRHWPAKYDDLLASIQRINPASTSRLARCRALCWAWAARP
jgi:hypothetical protein